MTYDVIIIGSGIAGLYAGVLLQEVCHPLIVCKQDPRECNTLYAQGGIAVSLDDEDVPLHVEDTMQAGAGYNDRDMVELMCQQSRHVVGDLMRRGLEFDKDGAGELLYTREGAHSTSRILHGDGDATGRVMHGFLLSCFRGPIMSGAVVVDLLMDGEACYGIRLCEGEKSRQLYAKHVVIASGGVGSLFAMHTNSKVISGDMQGLAYEKGLALKDMEMLQFHPTVYVKGDGARKLLLSEALRGEGALVVDRNGKRFLFDYDSRGELASRDIISRAIFDHCQKKGQEAYLSFQSFGQNHLRKRFPNIYHNLTALGFNLPKDKIPISPAFHYAMGGIAVDQDSRVLNRERLYAIGECACTGVHGANRLASNSLLEALVFAKQAFSHIVETGFDQDAKQFEEKHFTLKKERDQVLKERLRTIMWEHVGIVRTPEGLALAMQEVEQMLEEDIGRLLQLRLLTARAIITAALQRTQSLGAHFIQDQST